MNSSTNTELPTIPGWLQTLSQSQKESMLASTAITLPSVLLYMAEVVILLANWGTVQSPFFALLILRALLEQLYFCCSFFNFRLPVLGLCLGWFKMFPGWLLCIFYWSKTYLVSAANLATVFMMLNRWSSIANPLTHRKHWNRIVIFAVLLILCIPLIYTGHMFGYTVYVKLQSDGKTFLLWDTGIDTGNKPNDTLIVATTMMAFMLLTLAINMAIIRAYLKQKQITGVNQRQNSQVERKLTIYTAVTFIADFVNALYYLMLYLSFYQITNWGLCTPQVCNVLAIALLNQNSLVNDFTHEIVPAILLLWASDTVQHEFGKLFGKFRGNMQVHTVSNNHFTTTNTTTNAHRRNGPYTNNYV